MTEVSKAFFVGCLERGVVGAVVYGGVTCLEKGDREKGFEGRYVGGRCSIGCLVDGGKR